MNKTLLFSVILGMASYGSADLLRDSYSNGELGSYDSSVDFRGGFNAVSSNPGDDPGVIAVEAPGSGIAQIENAKKKSDFRGMLSNEKSGWSILNSTADKLITTWHIDSAALKDTASLMALTWQTDSGITTDIEVGVMLDLNNNVAYVSTGGTNNNLGYSVELDASFGDPGEAFTIVTTFTADGFVVQGEGAFTKTAGNGPAEVLVGSWDGNFFDRNSLNDYYLGALVQAKGNEGLVVNVDSVHMEAIPEPAVISFIGLFGLGIIITRRIFDK